MKYRFLFFVVIVLFQSSAYGCDCVMESIEKQVKKAKSIIVVKVTNNIDTLMEENLAVIDYEKGFLADVSICKVLKGNFEKKQSLTISSYFDNCSMIFKNNKSYLLFTKEHNGKIYVKECSYSGELGKSKRMVRKIRRIVRKKS